MMVTMTMMMMMMMEADGLGSWIKIPWLCPADLPSNLFHKTFLQQHINFAIKDPAYRIFNKRLQCKKFVNWNPQIYNTFFFKDLFFTLLQVGIP